MPSSLPLKFQLILKDSFDFFSQHLRQIAALCLPFLLVAAVFQLVLTANYPLSDLVFLIALLGNIAVYPIYTAALIHFMSRLAQKEHPTNSQLISAALPQWPSFLALKFLTTLLILLGASFLVPPVMWMSANQAPGAQLVVAVMIMVGLGLGVWLWVRLVFAEFYLVLFRLHPLRAMERSLFLTKGHAGPILALLIITYLPILLIIVSLQSFQTVTGSFILQVITFVGGAFITQFINVVLFRTFMEIMKLQQDDSAE